MATFSLVEDIFKKKVYFVMKKNEYVVIVFSLQNFQAFTQHMKLNVFKIMKRLMNDGGIV